MIRWSTLASFLIAGLFGISAWGQGRPVLVTDPDTALQFVGFRIKPPSGREWYLGLRDNQNVMFGKKTDSRKHSFVAVAFSRELPSAQASSAEFLEFSKKFKSSGLEPARHSILEQKFVLNSMPAPECVRYRFKLEDRAVPVAPGEVLLQEDVGVMCLHPGSRSHFVDVRYSERGGPQPSSAQMREEGEGFLRAVEFTPLR